MDYVKFKDTSYSSYRKIPFLSKMLSGIIGLFLPNANPTLGNNIFKVYIWYIEYDTKEDYTNREVGLDENGSVVFKAPYGKNLGFWCNEDMQLDDYYRRFNSEKIEKSEFERMWKKHVIGEQVLRPVLKKTFWILLFIFLLIKCMR